jgi:nitrite reductase/ring-hydroxylating ferredoxin subunit
MVNALKKIILRFKGFKLYPIGRTLDEACAMVPDQKAVILDADGLQFCLTRKDTRFFAFLNSCPHQALPLNRGKMEKDCWVCPYHNHHFSLKNGENKTMPQPERLIFAETVIIGNRVYLLIPSKIREIQHKRNMC